MKKVPSPLCTECGIIEDAVHIMVECVRNEDIRNDMLQTCRYEGKQPFLCCKNQPQVPEPPEPEGCKSQAPPLPAPSLNITPIEQFLWNKCLSYQRYVYKCVNDENNPEIFTRQNTCGIPKTNYKLRMIGADPAFLRQFPHMAVVGCQDPKKDADIIWVGGGSLISENFILTAAHVVWSPNYGRIYYALLGTLNKKSHDSLLVNVINTIPHKLYQMNSETKMYDIALLRLHERVKFNEFIRPICLPVSDRKITDHRIVAGWGQINSRGDTSDELRYVNIREQNYTSSCLRLFGDIFDPKTMICAHGAENTVMDSCKGDSGGPLMALMTNIICSYSIEGIVSFGTNTCGGNVGVYTRVTAYLDWIVERVWPDEWMKFNTKT
ncbi:venom protease-like [Melitaea cinxia]|uniref:venom protease-like n=1 Tax=Melitaea cinxia TaxID=113334 RepID=UPI001E274694|nr:venom protease-like [Melitaea cinxia]